MKSFVIIVSVLLLSVSAWSQPSFTDPRDGRVYRTVEIGDKIWMLDNLKFEDDLSHCPNFNTKDEECERGNFYSYKTLNEVCPSGWRISSTEDWSVYFYYFLENIDFDKTELQITGERNKKKIDIRSASLNLFQDGNPLELKPIGRVEANTLYTGNFVDYWTYNPVSKDEKFHLHLTANVFSGHSHSHHIKVPLDEQRKFPIRCIKDSSSSE